MKKKLELKKLQLNRETLIKLDGEKLEMANGGMPRTECCYQSEQCFPSCVVC